MIELVIYVALVAMGGMVIGASLVVWLLSTTEIGPFR